MISNCVSGIVGSNKSVVLASNGQTTDKNHYYWK